MPTTIIHTADVHLDRAFSGLGMMSGIAAARREELRAAIRRLVDLTLEVGADALTIGGDLYEHDRATLDTGNFLAQQFARLETVPVLISPGNHDPYVPDSLYRRVDWPSNVTIFSATELRPVSLPSGVTVWGVAHDGPEVRRNLVAGFRVSGTGPHVLLFHGSNMSGAPEKRTGHAPFLPEDIAASGADFALLGHYHSGRVYKDGKPLFAYPGTPEALDFSEEGEHFVLRLDIDGSTVEPQPVRFGRVRYRTHHLDVTDLVTSDEVRSAIVELEAPVIQRVILEGQLNRDVDLDTGALYNMCAERFTYLDLVDRTEPSYDLEELAEESTTKGAFVRLIQERGTDGEGDRELLELAMRYGLRAFDGQEVRTP
ncbi:MAG: DNA repair exonuclease [Chloroflexi bacterium]|nr:DNA repair exonuclease [Chloroflexota bacterium]